MSIKLGKEKNWGSRTGTKRIPRKIGDPISHLIAAGLTTDMIKAIADGSEEFRQAAAEVLSIREAIELVHKEEPKLVFKTKLGQLYQGDCLQVLRKLPDESLDCVFADPPFNLSKEYDNGHTDALPEDDYLEWTRAWIELCVSKLKPGGSLFVYNIPKWAVPTANLLSQVLTFRNWIAVDLTLSMPISGRLYPSHYALLYFSKGGRPNHFHPHRVPIRSCPKCGKEQNDYGGYKKKMNPKGINLRDVWTDIPPVRHSKFKNRDANELHLKLLDRVIEMSTGEGDLVFDPFGGSGTTFAAAELKGRRWIGAELGSCDPIIARLNDLSGDKTMFARLKEETNLLFTDAALRLRAKSGLPVDNFRVRRDQVARALGEMYLKQNPQLDLDTGANKANSGDEANI